MWKYDFDHENCHVRFIRLYEGEEREVLSLKDFVDYTNNLEDALLVVAADPNLAKTIHSVVKKHIS